jgi:hypothetical protein
MHPGRSNVWGSDEHEVLNVPRVCVIRKAVHNIAGGGVSTPIQWDGKLYDTDGMWDPAGSATTISRLTCRTAGLYDVHGWILWPANATSYRQLWIVVNAVLAYSTVIQPNTVPTVVSQETNRHIALNAGDYIQLAAGSNAGALTLPVTGSTAAYDHGFQACLISTI